MERSRATAVRVLIACLAAYVLVGGPASHVDAVTSLTGKEFGYWGHPTLPPQHTDHVSLVHIKAADSNFVNDMNALAGTSVKAIVEMTQYLAVGECLLPPNWETHWHLKVAEVSKFTDRIAAIDIGHEPDLTGKTCFPGNAGQKALMVHALETRSAIVKSMPGWAAMKTFITYGPSAELVTGPLAQNIDWNAFDCYGPFENCWAHGLSIPQVVNGMVAQLSPQQMIFLVPDASTYLYDGSSRRMHESELFIRAIEYWQTTMTHPRVKGMTPFLWDVDPSTFSTMLPTDTMYDIQDSPGLTTLYRAIGQNVLTGAVPALPPFNVPVDCVITAGTTCNVNLSWANVNGSNLHLFARLVSNFDIGGGPFCPGATSCSIALGPGDYIFELRENSSIGSKLISAKRSEVRHPAAATGQIASTPTDCYQQGVPGGGVACSAMFTANVQNAPNASFFQLGGGELCNGTNRTSLCSFDAGQLPLGTYTFTVMLRVNKADPNSQILDQRTFSMTVRPPL